MTEKPTMLSYIKEEQATLLKALNQYPKNIDVVLNHLPQSQQLLVLATGSSINAALSAKYYIESKAQLQIDIQEPYNYLNYVKHQATQQIVLGISQSGQSTATIEALQTLPADNLKIAVTSIPDSEITAVTDATLDILSGRERVGYVTLGFSATVLALMLFGLRLGVKKGLISSEQEQSELAEFEKIILAIDETIERTTAFFHKNALELSESQRFMSIAYGSAFGTAKEMETKFSETIRVPSQGIDLEAFMHGPYLEMQPDYRLFFLDTPANAAVTEKAYLLKKYEEKVTPYIYLVSVTKEQATNDRELILPKVADDEKAPLLLIVPFQVLCWYVSRGKGIDITQRIFTDFAQSVKSKTTVQDYV
ncbi:glucoselysine-6-phosphate deglycase [Enterococcus sp. PF1-24]|uniref:SIS domain-containing protein n=1 Tax=unclassified Enterococcus TaxID=2608891 RepID=UPI0024734633|nr:MULTISPECIES: SIS domain-containing protein [unclassified Enterococcus]MDH6363356.1 glucoselysine-6-phosphate deglycase [Enterococcus sp. PFB1-1]MDH6400343.1 glucoselysine-6-phosphate deglycase [Enterococcus sp. PF1-24]